MLAAERKKFQKLNRYVGFANPPPIFLLFRQVYPLPSHTSTNVGCTTGLAQHLLCNQIKLPAPYLPRYPGLKTQHHLDFGR